MFYTYQISTHKKFWVLINHQNQFKFVKSFAFFFFLFFSIFFFVNFSKNFGLRESVSKLVCDWGLGGRGGEEVHDDSIKNKKEKLRMQQQIYEGE